MLSLPASVVDLLYRQLERLEALERREAMKLVQRRQRQG